MGALLSGADLNPSLLPVITQSLPPAWHFNQIFWVFLQTLTKTLSKPGCLCFHAKETSAVLPGVYQPFPSSPQPQEAHISKRKPSHTCLLSAGIAGFHQLLDMRKDKRSEGMTRHTSARHLATAPSLFSCFLFNRPFREVYC